MNSRERVLSALKHQPTDRVPRLLYEEAIGYTPAIEKLLKEHCGSRPPREHFEMDITHVEANPTRLERSRFAEWMSIHAETALASGQVDEWGVWWRSGSLYHFAHIESPLRGIRDLARLEQYPWPDLEDSYRYETLREQVEKLHAEGLAVAAYAGSVFEQSWFLRGMEDLLMDLMTAPELAVCLLDRTAAFQRRMATEFAQAGVDIIITGDDVAGQKGMLMRLDLWRQFFKPRLAETIRAVKAANPQSYVFYHSDGNMEAIIPDLIEIGLDILNPLQPECMDPAEIKRKYGDRLSFWGSVSVQRTMSQGTPQAVREEVRKRIATVGQNGGFILAPAHVLGPETPWENIVAFFEAADNRTTRNTCP